MECPFYSTERSQLFEALSHISNNFLSFNETRKLSFILNIGEAKSAEPISKFISNIGLYKKRRNVVASTTWPSFAAPHVILCISILIFSCYLYIYICLCICVLWLEWCKSCMPIKKHLIWFDLTVNIIILGVCNMLDNNEYFVGTAPQDWSISDNNRSSVYYKA